MISLYLRRLKLLSPADSTIQLFYVVVTVYFFSTLFAFGLPTMLQYPPFPHLLNQWIPSQMYSWWMGLIIVGCSISLLILSFHPWIRTLRILAFLSWIGVVAQESSFGKTINDHYSVTFAMLVFIFLPREKRNEHFKEQVLTVAKVQAVMCYAMAGLWKVRVIPLLISMNDFLTNFSNVIAHEHFKYGHELSALSSYLVEWHHPASFMFYGLVLLQLTSPLYVWSKKGQIFFCFFICLFHILSEVIVHINFRINVYVMLVFFLWHPLWQIRSQKSTS